MIKSAKTLFFYILCPVCVLFLSLEGPHTILASEKQAEAGNAENSSRPASGLKETEEIQENDGKAEPPSREQAGESRKIRVAYPIQKGLTDVDENGKYCGYTYEYLQEIAQYTGWDYEFVTLEGNMNEVLVTMLDMVYNGEIDLMSGMLYTEETSRKYSYSSLSYGTGETVLQTTPEKMNKVMVNSQVDQHMRIAVTKTTGRSIDELEDYCQMNLITPEYVVCKDDKEMIQAIKDDRADALINTSMNYLEGMRTFARFAPKPFYFICSPKDETGLVDQLNMALFNIEQSNPYFTTQLYEKYFEPHDYDLQITDEERSYIESKGAVRVGFLTNQPPFQYLQKDNTYAGITIDLLNTISERLGLRFELCPASTMEELFQMGEAGKCDVVAGIMYDYDFAGLHQIVMTQPYLTTQYMLVMNEETTRTGKEGKRLALPVSSIYNGYTVGNVERFESRSDCMNAVRNGSADYTYVDAYTAQYFINQPSYWRLKMVPLASEALSLCFGLPKPADVQLLLLMNKVINTLTVEEMQTITTENTFRDQQLSYMDLARMHPVETIAVITGILLVVFTLFALLLYQRTRHNRRAAIELKKRFRVCSLTNDYFFEYNIATQLLNVSIPSAKSSDGIELRSFRLDEIKPEYREKESGRPLHLYDLLNAHESGSWECHGQFPDGAYHWMRVALEPILENGTPSCIIGKINLIDNEKQEKELLTNQAQLDGLTGIYNSKTCREKIEEALAAQQPGEKGALILFDIDHFKSINDTYGHMQGDAVLKQLSSILKQNIRPEDIFGRFGGDEFILYLFHITDASILSNRCQELQQVLAQGCRNGEIPFTVSIGAILSDRVRSYAELLQAADAALYNAKGKGRNCYAIAEESVPEEGISGT